MLFNSVDYVIFFPISIIVYYLLPNKVRYIWLLFASYYFYMSWNPQYALLILASTLTTYVGGRVIQKEKENNETSEGFKKKSKKWLIAVIVINLGLLVFFKYLNFGITNINAVLSIAHVERSIPYLDILLPVGISFYTFQALGYIIDVYNDKVSAEKNFLKYALFVSFFPQLVAGPIERTSNLMGQLSERHKLTFENFRVGVLWMLWGYFMKLVIADRVAIIVDAVYADPETYSGVCIVVATILFAIQIYCDFGGYTMIARGSAKIMGINLMENFNAPYLSKNVAEFWRRWHISLSTWFKDYLYIPLGGNRKGKIRKYINIFVVFLVSGFWHGAAWGYVIWGGLNGLYQIIGGSLQRTRDAVVSKCKIKRDAFSHQLFKWIVTFALVDFSWLFFRAKSISESIRVLKNIANINLYSLFDGTLFSFGVGRNEFYFVIVAIILLFAVDAFKYKGIDVAKAILKQGMWLRVLIFAGLFLVVIMLGVYGVEYDASQFIYFQF